MYTPFSLCMIISLNITINPENSDPNPKPRLRDHYQGYNVFFAYCGEERVCKTGFRAWALRVWGLRSLGVWRFGGLSAWRLIGVWDFRFVAFAFSMSSFWPGVWGSGFGIWMVRL